jgi:hypothetical protein
MNFFAPYADEWKLETKDIERAEKLYAQDYGKRCHTTPSKLLLFLYTKGILAEEKFEYERTNTFTALLNSKTDNLKKDLERLTTIVEKGETTPTRLKMKAESVFDDFVALHPEWNEEDSFVVFRDHKNLKVKSHALVERFQKSVLHSRLCGCSALSCCYK